MVACIMVQENWEDKNNKKYKKNNIKQNQIGIVTQGNVKMRLSTA